MRTKLQVWLDQWKARPAVFRERLSIGHQFLEKHFRRPPYNFDDTKILSYLRGIDFHKNVRVIPIPRGTLLVAFKDPRISPFLGNFFTISGTSISNLGITHESQLRHLTRSSTPHDNVEALRKTKTQVRYVANIPIPEVLECYAADTVDFWSKQNADGTPLKELVSGGGIQYLIPRPEYYLIYSTPFPNR